MTTEPVTKNRLDTESSDTNLPGQFQKEKTRPAEIGGPAGPEPTRYGDWEKKGRCIDF